MKKLLAKIVGITTGIAMAVGVGIGIADSREATRLNADDSSFAIALNGKALANATSYQTDQTTNNYDGGDSVATLKWSNLNPNSGQVKGNQSTQNNNFWLYNNTALPGNVRSITLSGISGTYTANKIYAATSSSAALSTRSTGSSSAGTNGSSSVSWSFAGSSGGYFAVFATNGFTSDTVTATTITITYEESGGGGDPVKLDTPEDLSSNGTVLTWSNVENNNGYSYSINTEPETTGNINKNATSFDANSLLLDSGIYTFKIKARGNGLTYLDSDYCDTVSFTVPVYVVDTFVVGDFAATDNSYAEFSIPGTSRAKYVGYSAKPTGDNAGYIQFNNWSSPKNRGIATSSTCGYIRRVGVTWGNANSKEFTVYVGNSAYSSSSAANTGTAQTTTLSSSNTMVAISGDYQYVSLYPNGAIYPASVSFYWEEVKIDQSLSVNKESAYANQTITASSDATTSVTWSVVEDAGTTAGGASVTSAGVISVTSPGTVTVKAVASGYNDATIQVTFNEVPAVLYDVTFDSNGGSSSPELKTIPDNGTFTFPSPGIKEHYSFDGWTSTGSEPYYAVGATSPAVVADIAYTAHWTEDAKYTVTYSAGDNGSGSYADANHYGGTYTLLAFNGLDGVAADSGYRFKDYTVDGLHKNPGDTFELSTNTAVTVNFEEIPLEYVVTFGTAEASGQLANFSNTSYVIPSGVTLDNIQGNLYSNNENEAAAIRFGKGGTTGSFDVSIDNNYYIKKIIANLKYYGTDTTAEFAITPEDGEPIGKTLTSSLANYEYDISASCTSKATLGTTIAGKRAFLSRFTIVYDLKTTEQKLETNNKTLSALKFTYEETAGDYSITNAAIRFGGFISQELWSELEDVEGYGVVVASASSLGSDSIKDKYNAKKVVFAADANDDNDDVDSILNAICSDLSAKKASASGANPAYANDEQKTFMGVELLDSYRVWTSKKEINESDFATQYTSVAYIKIDGDIIFLKETTTSFKDLAVSRQDTLDPSDPAFGAIEYIAGNY